MKRWGWEQETNYDKDTIIRQRENDYDTERMTKRERENDKERKREWERENDYDKERMRRLQ